MLTVTKAIRLLVPTIAKSKPSKPPSSPNKVLSVSSCRSMRRRFAPSAVRIAISFCRLVALARSRLATFAQAISKTRLTAAIKTISAGRMSPVTCSCNGITCDSMPPLTSGYSLSSRLAIAFISTCACSAATPGFKRPIIFKLRMSRTSGTSSGVRGTHRSALDTVSSNAPTVAENEGGNLNDGGIIPITV